MPVRPAVALHPDRTNVGEQDDWELPDVAIQPGRSQLSSSDRVRLSQDGEPLPGDLADDPDRQPRAGERMPPDDPGGSPSCAPTARTSSLNSVRSGSTSWNCRSCGRPPTL